MGSHWRETENGGRHHKRDKVRFIVEVSLVQFDNVLHQRRPWIEESLRAESRLSCFYWDPWKLVSRLTKAGFLLFRDDGQVHRMDVLHSQKTVSRGLLVTVFLQHNPPNTGTYTVSVHVAFAMRGEATVANFAHENGTVVQIRLIRKPQLSKMLGASAGRRNKMSFYVDVGVFFYAC